MARYGSGNNLYEDENGQIRARLPQTIDARAPQADLSSHVAMTPSAPYQLTKDSLTPSAIWNQMFHRNQASVTAPSQIQAPSQLQAGATGQNAPLPSLTQSASGVNHATAWNQGVIAPASLNAFSTTPGDVRNILQQYSPDPGAAKTTFDSTPGTRQPFIGGKLPDGTWGNVAADYIAGGKFSSAKAGSDPTLDPAYVNKITGTPNLISSTPDDPRNKFTWSSAFR